MRNRIVGGIAAAWGAAVLINSFINGGPQGAGAYGTGQVIGLIFGGVLLIVGLYYLITGGPGPKVK